MPENDDAPILPLQNFSSAESSSIKRESKYDEGVIILVPEGSGVSKARSIPIRGLQTD